MTLEIKTTLGKHYEPTFVIYGAGKIGKTHLISTMSRPFVGNLDRGTCSLGDFDIPYVDIMQSNQIDQFYDMVVANRNNYDWVVIDDLTELGDLRMREMKSGIVKQKSGKAYENKMQMYGDMADWCLERMHKFRNLYAEYGLYVAFNCKEEKIHDPRTGGQIMGPMFPGKQIQNLLDHFCSEIYHLELWTDENQVSHRVLRTQRNNALDAGSRFGKLGELEFANMTAIIDKMKATG